MFSRKTWLCNLVTNSIIAQLMQIRSYRLTGLSTLTWNWNTSLTNRRKQDWSRHTVWIKPSSWVYLLIWNYPDNSNDSGLNKSSIIDWKFNSRHAIYALFLCVYWPTILRLYWVKKLYVVPVLPHFIMLLEITVQKVWYNILTYGQSREPGPNRTDYLLTSVVG